MAMHLLQRARGVLATMGIWAVVFGAAGVAGLIPLSLLGALPPFELNRFLRIVVVSFVRWGLGGAVTGFAFATLVAFGERRRTFANLSARRFTVWGFVAAAIVPMAIAMIYELTGRSSIAINLRAGVIFAGICGTVGAAL